MVRKKASWTAAHGSPNVKTLFRLAHTRGSGVRGPYPSNIYFFFRALPGHPNPQEVAWSTLPTPAVNSAATYDPSITGPGDPMIDHVFTIAGTAPSTFYGMLDIRN